MKKIIGISMVFVLAFVLLTSTTLLAEDVNRGGIVEKTANVQGVIVKNYNPFSPNALHNTFGGFYETLVLANTHLGEIEPWLASDHYWEDDLKTLVFELEEDVYWNDGEKFTADDVVFTLGLGKEHEEISQAGIWDSGLLEVNARDDYTVEFVFDEVNTTVMPSFGSIYIVPEHIWSDIEDPAGWSGNEDPVGTGPFVHDEGSFQEMSYRMVSNPDYWQLGEDGEPLPYIDGVQYVGATGNEQAAMEIISGDVDWGTYFIANIDQTYVSRDPQNHNYWLPEGNIVYLSLNNGQEPFSNRNLRRAIAMGLDQERITEIMGSGAVPSNPAGVKSGFVDWIPEEAEENMVEFDPLKAREMIEAEGYEENSSGIYEKDGEELSFDLYVPTGWTDWITATEAISDQLAAVGVEASINQVAWPSPFMDNLIEGDYHMSMGYANSGFSPFYQFDNILPSRLSAPIGESADNHSQVRYENETVDQAFRDYRKTDDEEEQRELIGTILTEFTDDMPMIPLFFNPTWFQYNTSNFKGWPNENDPYTSPNTAGMTKMKIFLNLQPVD